MDGTIKSSYSKDKEIVVQEKTGLTTVNCGLRFAQFGKLCAVVCDRQALCGFNVGDNVELGEQEELKERTD